MAVSTEQSLPSLGEIKNRKIGSLRELCTQGEIGRDERAAGLGWGGLEYAKESARREGLKESISRQSEGYREVRQAIAP